MDEVAQCHRVLLSWFCSVEDGEAARQICSGADRHVCKLVSYQHWRRGRVHGFCRWHSSWAWSNRLRESVVVLLYASTR